MALALVAPLFLISGSCGFVAPPAAEYQLGPSSHRFTSLFLGKEVGSISSQSKARSSANSSSKLEHWNESLKQAKIIPDVLPTEVPQPLKVLYFDDDINYGNQLEYHRIEMYPVDLDWLTHEGDYYTVVMTDPDFPDTKNPSKREYLHWMITNMKEADIRGGQNIAQYVPPPNKHAPTTTNLTCKGIHRIVFVVYKQLNGSINVSPGLYTPPDDLEHSEIIPHNREKFSSKDFAKKYNLVPYAANYFTMNMDIVEEDYED